MIRLAVPGMIMIEAEYLAFEILTLASSRFGPEALAAQSILATIASVTYQLPFALSIAASTRIANLIGAGLVDAAVTSTQVVGSFPDPQLRTKARADLPSPSGSRSSSASSTRP